MIDPQARREKAVALFSEGYNCAQSVVLAFEDLLPISDKDAVVRMSSSFGGGVARLREVCGAVSGMAMVEGYFEGYSNSETGAPKIEFYRKVQSLAEEFEAMNGSVVCRDLLGLPPGHSSPDATPRTPDFYEKRPCPKVIGDAAYLLARHLNEIGL